MVNDLQKVNHILNKSISDYSTYVKYLSIGTVLEQVVSPGERDMVRQANLALSNGIQCATNEMRAGQDALVALINHYHKTNTPIPESQMSASEMQESYGRRREMDELSLKIYESLPDTIPESQRNDLALNPYGLIFHEYHRIAQEYSINID